MPEWDQRVLELTGGAGADLIVENGGAGTLNLSLRAIRYGGTISLLGVLSGIAAEVSTGMILRRGVRVQGIYVGSREAFESMNRAVHLHQIRPYIDRVFPFEQARDALAYMESGAHFGKIVIRR